MGASASAGGRAGFRVFGLLPGSPAAEAGLEVFFDYVVGIDGEAAEAADGAAFLRKVCERENSEVRLAVYNIRSHAFREVGVTPRKWAGEGLLGAVLRYDALDEFVDAYAISVQSVASNSPAETAGLIPLKDFPLGTAEVMFRNIDDVSEIVSGCKWKNTTLYVYNSDSESVREVTIMPFTGWGGDDCLGADMRPVALHKIPAPRQSQAMARPG